MKGAEKAERQNSRGPPSRLMEGGWRPLVLRQLTQEHSRKETEKKQRGGRRVMLDTSAVLNAPAEWLFKRCSPRKFVCRPQRDTRETQTSHSQTLPPNPRYCQ